MSDDELREIEERFAKPDEYDDMQPFTRLGYDAGRMLQARTDIPALVAEVRRLRAEVIAERASYDALEENREIVEAENAQLRAENERLRGEMERLAHSSRSDSFRPNWASPPGDTIRDAMKERGLTIHSLAHTMAIGEMELLELLETRRAITPDVAMGLAAAFGNSSVFWLRREAQYRTGLADIEERARAYQDDGEEATP